MKEWEVIEGDALTVLRTMQDASVDAVITDPPYGIAYQSAWRIDKAARLPKIANDARPFVWWLYDAYRVTKDGGALVCFCRWDVQDAFKQAIQWAGYTVRSQVIWDRMDHGMGDLEGAFAPQHDVIWYATKGRVKLQGPRPMSVIRVRRLPADALAHPNEKPVPLMRALVRAVTKPGDLVLDCFAGTCSTGRGCLQERRRFVGIEIEPHYCNLGRERLDTRQTTMEFSA